MSSAAVTVMMVLVGVVLVSDVVIAQTTFAPGCSFVGGQCMYTVQLGHEGQCDKRAVTSDTTSTSPSCCSSYLDDLGEIRATLQGHEQQLEALQKSLLTAQSELANATSHANETEEEIDALLALLKQKEEELNTTQSEMARILGKANDEIQALRADLTNATQNLGMCQAALGVTPSNVGQPASLAGDVNLFYCKFDTDTDCGFTHLTGQTTFVLMHKGSSASTGPTSDHSIGAPAGTYISIDANTVASTSTSSAVKTATMESPMFDPANMYCIFFWYTMRGPHVLNMDVNVRIGGGTGYPVWSMSGDQNEDWTLGQVELDSEYTANPFKIDFVANTDAYKSYSSFSGYINHNYDGDIGIDDVYIYNTSCSNIPKCPAGSYMHTSSFNVTSCYSFHATAMTWTDAYDVCRREGPWSGLVSIETQEEQIYLVGLIKGDTALSLVGQNGFYTSGNDEATEHSFVWTDTGSPRTVPSFGWHTGQPNNVGGNQNCLLMEYQDDDYAWGDVDCTTTHPFICEVYWQE